MFPTTWKWKIFNFAGLESQTGAVVTQILNLQDLWFAPSSLPRHNNLGPLSGLICRKLPQVWPANIWSQPLPLQWWDFLRCSYQLDPETMDSAHAVLCTGSACCPSQGLPQRPDVPLRAAGQAIQSGYAEIHHRFKWSEIGANLAADRHQEEHLHTQ